MFTMFHDSELMDVTFRKKVISEILASTNDNRKMEHLRRRDIYKDQTKEWVIKKLADSGLAPETVQMMAERAANISICKKIVDKLARTYSGGVTRTFTGGVDEQTQETMDQLLRSIKYDTKQKNLDKKLELHKNTVSYIVPELVNFDLDELGNPINKEMAISMRVLAPYQYDVINDAVDRERARCFILTDFRQQEQYRELNPQQSDGIDQTIADDPEDQDADKDRHFIWWSETYHFTTDAHGEIVADKSPEDLLNPIGMLNFTNYHDEQEGAFWARGGEDLIDGSILVNTLLTDLFSIAYQQGWGQWIFTGRDLKGKVQIGVNHAILLEYDKDDDPVPTGQVVSANPPIGDWLNMIAQYVALLLTTNKLSTSAVSMDLNAQTMASGIAMLVEMSEANGEIEDKQSLFADNERYQAEVIKRWYNALKLSGEAIQTYKEMPALPEKMETSVKFNNPKPVISETEKLANLEKRKDLGINTMIDLIRMDNPDLTVDEAEQKALEILEEKLERMNSAMAQSIEGAVDGEGEEEEEQEEESE